MVEDTSWQVLIRFFSSWKIQRERFPQSIPSTFKGKGPCTPHTSSLSFPGYPEPGESIWSANELVRIKEPLWSEPSPNLLEDERYTATSPVPCLLGLKPPCKSSSPQTPFNLIPVSPLPRSHKKKKESEREGKTQRRGNGNGRDS